MVPLCLTEPLYSVNKVGFHILLWITNQFCQSGGKKAILFTVSPAMSFGFCVPTDLDFQVNLVHGSGVEEIMWGKTPRASGQRQNWVFSSGTQSEFLEKGYLVLLLGIAPPSDTNFYVMECSGLLVCLTQAALSSSAAHLLLSLQGQTGLASQLCSRHLG